MAMVIDKPTATGWRANARFELSLPNAMRARLEAFAQEQVPPILLNPAIVRLLHEEMHESRQFKRFREGGNILPLTEASVSESRNLGLRIPPSMRQEIRDLSAEDTRKAGMRRPDNSTVLALLERRLKWYERERRRRLGDASADDDGDEDGDA